MCAQCISSLDRDLEHVSIPLPHPAAAALPTACPLSCSKLGLVLQQTSHLNVLLPPYHSADGQVITSSIFTIPCFTIVQRYMAFPMPLAALGEGGSTRKIGRVAPASN